VATDSSKSSAKQEKSTDRVPDDAETATQTDTSLSESSDTVIGDTSLTQALFAPEKEAAAAAEPAPEDHSDAPAEPQVTERSDPAPQPVDAPPPPQPQTVVEKRGPGLMPLLLGGVVVAGLGYGAAYMGLLGTSTQSDDIAQALQAQSEALSALQSQVSTLATEPDATPEVDLSPVLNELASLSDRLDGTTNALGDITARITDLEERPVLTGEVSEDSAAMAAAMEILQNELGEQQAANQALMEEMRSVTDEARSAIADAESRSQETMAAALADAEATVAEATAQAEASVAAATAQAALSRIRAALASGDPFASALADLPDTVEVPEALAASAETGVPTLETLQADFPGVARAALPVALLEVSAEGNAGDRAIAFLRGQFGGRAIAPRDGDDPDAVLSRAQAAVTSGDLSTAVAELATLPEGAQSELADWVAAAENRVAADAALTALAAALDSAN